MIKVQNNIATRDTLPAFLIGLAPESLADLRWTDPALGVRDLAWWPEVDQTPALQEGQTYDGTETLTVGEGVVHVVRGVRDMTPEEIEAMEPVLDLRITKLAFRNRFTQGEKVAIELAALDDPSSAMAQRQMSASVRAYLADLSAATFIDLAREDLQEGVESLEAASLIGAGRADIILSGEIAELERYRG